MRGKQNTDGDALSTIPPHPVKHPVAIILLSILLVSSVVMVVCGAAFFALGIAPLLMRILALLVGVGLIGWYGWLMSQGSGRRTPVVTDRTTMHVVPIAAFGLPMGFALFDVLTGQGSGPHFAMLGAGTVGMVTSWVVFVRDTALLEDAAEVTQQPVAIPPASQQPAMITQIKEPVFFDPTDTDTDTDTHVSPPLPQYAFSAPTPQAPLPPASRFSDALPAAPKPGARRRAMIEEPVEEFAEVAAPRRAARRAALED